MIEIPFKPSLGLQTRTTTILSTSYVFDARWNSRDAAWYLDLFEADRTPIVYGMKVVLGTYLGRRVNHPLFRAGVLVAIDTSGADIDARFDDLGARIVVAYIPIEEALAAIQQLQESQASS